MCFVPSPHGTRHPIGPPRQRRARQREQERRGGAGNGAAQPQVSGTAWRTGSVHARRGEATGVCILTSICDVQEQDDARAPQEGLEGSANCHSPLSLMRLPMACAGESAQSQVKRRRGGAATAAAGGPSPLRCSTCPPLLQVRHLSSPTGAMRTRELSALSTATSLVHQHHPPARPRAQRSVCGGCCTTY